MRLRPGTVLLLSSLVGVLCACGSASEDSPGDLVTAGAPSADDDDAKSTGRTESDAGTSPPAETEGGAIPPASSATFRVMTYNIKHGEIGGLDAVGSAILAEKPDIVGLQEVDVDAARSGTVDQPHRLGQLTGMTDLFRTALTLGDGGAYGVALLSKYPILTSERLALTSSGEQRICAIVDVLYDKDVHLTVAVAHLDLQAAARLTQATEILNALSGKKNVLFMGDFNAAPDEASIQKFAAVYRDGWSVAGKGDGFTIPVAKPTRRIDYVFFGAEWKTPTAARVPTTTASDHLPLVVDVPRL